MIFKKDQIVVFYVLSNNSLYSQVASSYVPDNTDGFFSFSSPIKR